MQNQFTYGAGIGISIIRRNWEEIPESGEELGRHMS